MYVIYAMMDIFLFLLLLECPYPTPRQATSSSQVNSIAVLYFPFLYFLLPSALESPQFGLDISHHFLLCDEMVYSFEQGEQALHISAPLVEDVVCVSRFGKVDDSGGAVNLGVDHFLGDELREVALCFVLIQVKEDLEAVHADARVVLCDDAHVMLDDALAEICPALFTLRVADSEDIS